MTDDVQTPQPSTPSPAPEWVSRGRRILRIAAWVTGGLSVALTVTLIASGSAVLSAAFTESEGFDLLFMLQWTIVLGGPVFFAIAINLLVWRAMLGRLARRSRRDAALLAGGVGLALAAGSIIVVITLIGFGFVVQFIVETTGG